MINLQKAFGLRLWTRFFLLILGVVLITWIVVGVALILLGSARQTVDKFILDDVPGVVQTANLSSLTARLVLQSNNLLRTNVSQNDKIEKNLRATLTEIENIVIGMPSLNIETNTLNEFRKYINAVLIRLDLTRQAEALVIQKTEALRWLHIDIEDEATALVADFTFNVKTLTGILVRTESKIKKIEVATRLNQDQNSQNLFANIESEASAAATLGVQAAGAFDTTQLDRIEANISDSLSRISELSTEFSFASENTSLLQSLNELEVLLLSDDGLIENRRNWLLSRSILDRALDTLFEKLQLLLEEMTFATNLQSKLLKAKATSFADFVNTSISVLLVITVVAAAAGVAILFLYIRPSIIMPLRELTRAMRKISIGETPTLPDMSHKGRELSELASAVTTFEDAVAGRERAIKKLKETQLELVQTAKLAALGSMSAGLAHELNQPLGAIQHRYHLTKRALEKEKITESNEQLDKIANLVDRIETIIKRFRRFGQTTDIIKAPVKIHQSIDNALNLLRSALRKNRIKINIDKDIEDLTVLGDSVLLEQVLVNLLTNAIDSIAELGEPGVITISCTFSKGGNVNLIISDTGSGIDKSNTSKLFDPFFTTKEPNKGMGLGLSISYNLIAQMGGRLTLEPNQTAGARAIATLEMGVSNEG